jgi:hypothetical protein
MDMQKLPKVKDMHTLDMECFFFRDAIFKKEYKEQQEDYHHGGIYYTNEVDYFNINEKEVYSTSRSYYYKSFKKRIIEEIPKNYFWTKTFNKKNNKHYLVLMSNKEKDKFQVEITKNPSEDSLRNSILTLLCMKKEKDMERLK